MAAVLFVAFSGSPLYIAANQSQITISYSVIGGGQFQPPVFWYLSNGQNVTISLTGTPVTYTTDLDSPWGVSKALAGSPVSFMRWEINGSSKGVANGQTLVVLYYRQYYATFGVPDLGKVGPFAPPMVNYTSLAVQHSIVAGQSGWADYLSPYTYGDVYGILPNTRWHVPTPTGVVQSAALISPAYKEQFLMTFKLASSGPDPIKSTTLMETYGGSPTNRTLTAPGGSFWVDSKSSFAFLAAKYFGSGADRWLLFPLSEKIASAPANLTVFYFEQYPLFVSFTVAGGAEPSPPVLTSTSLSQGFSIQLITGVPPTWVDAGTGYSISSLLLGSSPAERWLTGASTAGVANGPTTLNLNYFHQVQVGFSYSVSGGGTISPSNATYVSFGVQRQIAITTTQQGVWADFGTTLSVQGSFFGSSPLERWGLGTAPSVAITSPGVLSFVYYHQFLVPTVYGISGGGQPGSPILTGLPFGAPLATAVTSGTSVWLDSGSSWSVSQYIPGSLAGERWAALGGVTGTMGSATFLALSYEHQYFVDLVANPQAGGAVGAGAWVRAGGSLGISESPSAGWAFASWSGNGAGSYSGREQSFSLIVSSPVQEKANFDVGFVVHVSGGGGVQVSFGTSSYSVYGQLTFYVPPGTKITLVATPALLQSFAGWQGIPAGNAGAVVLTADTPTGVNATFVLNQVQALGLVVLSCGVAVYVVAYLAWNRRVSPRRLWDSLRRKGDHI